MTCPHYEFAQYISHSQTEMREMSGAYMYNYRKKITIASFARRIQISSTKGHIMIQATLDSVVCRAQFFCLQMVKNKTKNKQKQQRTTTTRVERTQVVTKFISEHSIIDPLNSYISAIMLSSAKIMRFSH